MHNAPEGLDYFLDEEEENYSMRTQSEIEMLVNFIVTCDDLDELKAFTEKHFAHDIYNRANRQTKNDTTRQVEES